MADVNLILDRVQKLKKTGANKWLACCPAHDDRSPSLSVKYVDDKILIHCFAGCSVVDVVEALGLELKDLMPDNPDFKPCKPPRFNKSELFDRLLFESHILLVVNAQLMQGKPLSDVDFKRLIQAKDTIENITKEVR